MRWCSGRNRHQRQGCDKNFEDVIGKPPFQRCNGAPQPGKKPLSQKKDARTVPRKADTATGGTPRWRAAPPAQSKGHPKGRRQTTGARCRSTCQDGSVINKEQQLTGWSGRTAARARARVSPAANSRGPTGQQQFCGQDGRPSPGILRVHPRHKRPHRKTTTTATRQTMAWYPDIPMACITPVPHMAPGTRTGQTDVTAATSNSR